MASQHAVAKVKKKAEKLLNEKRLPEAKQAYEKVCKLSPTDSEALLNLGAINGMLGQLSEAEMAFRRVVELHPKLPQGQLNLGRLMVMQNRIQEAVDPFRAYVALQPNSLDGYTQLGPVLEALAKYEEAEQAYRTGLKLDPQNAGMLLGLGRVFRIQRKYDDAIDYCNRALKLQPDLGLAYFELGHIVKEQGAFEAAEEYYLKAMDLLPQEKASCLLSLGVLQLEQGRYEKALDCYDQVLAFHPASAAAHWNRGLILLLQGNFKEGWQGYEWRQKKIDWLRQMGGYERFTPQWQGEALEGRSILVYSEQGFGDVIQFGRYLKSLIDQGAQVHFHCQNELLPLFKQVEGLASLEVKSYQTAASQQYDYYVPLISLPYLLGTTLESVPAETPYLHAPQDKIEQWKTRLSGSGLKVGLVWAGGGMNPIDRMRSMELKAFAPLMALQEVQFYSLQKGSAEVQLRDVPERWKIIDLADELNDFSDTAAIIENIDLVITVETAVAHLAGALNCPTWVLLYSVPDWRWMLDRDDSPWYPSMKLFRQSAQEQGWDGVVERVKAALKSFEP